MIGPEQLNVTGIFVASTYAGQNPVGFSGPVSGSGLIRLVFVR